MIIISQLSVPFITAHEAMLRHHDGVTRRHRDRIIWFLEHDHIFTGGVCTNNVGDVTESKRYIDDGGIMCNGTMIPFVITDRGGQITYHGPGQLVVYFMINVRAIGISASEFVDTLHQWLMEALKAIGVHGVRDSKLPGIWAYVHDKNTNQIILKKIAFIGLRFKNGTSYHGASININPDLRYFYNISPCGMSGDNVTSVAEVLNFYHDLSTGSAWIKRQIVDGISRSLKYF